MAIKPPAEGRLVVRDPTCRGLTLRVTSTDVRTWSLEIKVHGRQRRFSVGNAKALGIGEARKRASVLRLKVIEEGHDPVASRREKRRDATAKHSGAAAISDVHSLLDSFERLKAKPNAIRSWPEQRQMIRANFGPLLDKAPTDLTRADFRAVLDAGLTHGAPISGK